MTAILGLNAFHGDAAACLIVDGEIVGAAEEERFRRIKHWAGVPTEAIRFCLARGGITLKDIDVIAVNRRPNANILRRLGFVASRRPSWSLLRARLKARRGVGGIENDIVASLGGDATLIGARIHQVEHHLCHLASTFLVSPFEDATVVSVDGFGDFASAMHGVGRGNELIPGRQEYFPHSLGMFYLAMTEFLGFPIYGDEYKVMGLAGRGQPEMMEAMDRILLIRDDGGFRLNLEMFRHHGAGHRMTWRNSAPVLDQAYSERMVELLGPARDPEEPLTDRHYALAASVQRQYERAFHGYVGATMRRGRSSTLCLAGGCAMNSLANGKLAEAAGVENLYVPPAPGDAGGAIGAAVLGARKLEPGFRGKPMRRADLGPEYSNAEVTAAVGARQRDLDVAGAVVTSSGSPERLVQGVAEGIANGAIVGWFQGRMEWGPRALGNRSILGDPRRAEMRSILNAKIKLREAFRPFAPSVLREEADKWFVGATDVPFMSQVLEIRPELRERIPAVVHVDGTGRLQTVDREDCPLYHALISAFHALTGIPMLLNTSFNENEPIVCTPSEALDCFLRTGMDMLVMENTLIERRSR